MNKEDKACLWLIKNLLYCEDTHSLSCRLSKKLKVKRLEMDNIISDCLNEMRKDYLQKEAGQ